MKCSSFIYIAKDLLNKSFCNKLYGFISIFGLLCTIFGFTLQDIIESIPEKIINVNIYALIALCITCLFVFFRLAYVAINEINNYKKFSTNSYNTTKLIVQLKKVINETNILIDSSTQDTRIINKILISVCDNIKLIFDKLTNSNCSVSIKVISADLEQNHLLSKEQIVNCEVVNIVRDRFHTERDTDDYKNAKHIIRDNTAFNSIISKLGKVKNFYRNNHVDLNNGYITTSPLQEYDEDTPKLPYKSELVYPIVKIIEGDTSDIKGFLCIDSDKFDSFNTKDIDNELAELFSSTFHNIIPRIMNNTL